MFTRTSYILLIANSIWHLFLSAIVAYYLYTFFKQRGNAIINKRYPRFIYITNTLCCLFISVNRPLYSVVRLLAVTETDCRLQLMVHKLSVAAYIFTAHPILWFELGRFWLMLYDINYCHQMSNKKWKHYIDPELISTNFWLKHKDTFGSIKFVTFATCCGWFVSSFIYGFLRIQTLYINLYHCQYADGSMTELTINSIEVVSYLLVATVPTCIAALAPKILDLFYVRYEIKIFVIVSWIAVFIGISAEITMLCTLHLLDSRKFLFYKQLLELIMINSYTLALTLGALTRTLLILRKTEKIKQCKQVDVEMKAIQITLSGNHISLDDPHARLNGILRDIYLFDTFVKYLCCQYSVEIILCFVEFIQFKQLIHSKFDEIISPNNFFDFLQCEVSQMVIPISAIVYKTDMVIDRNTTDMSPFFRIAYTLYQKYIKRNALFEINISATIRDPYIYDMEHFEQGSTEGFMEPIELFEYFDSIIEEMYSLLLISSDSFVNSPDMMDNKCLSRSQSFSNMDFLVNPTEQ